MRGKRPILAVLALAVVGASLGAGAVASVAASSPSPVASSSPSPVASPSPAATWRPPTPTAAATWPLVPATAAGPAPGFKVLVPVLMYHRVAPPGEVGRSLPELVVAPEVFAAQLGTLVAAGWRSITAAQLAADLAAGVRPPPRTFVITFDDGRRDGYTVAFPILRQLGLVATFYVITGRIGAATSLTPAQLRRLAAAGMEIGSHTVDHLRLSSAPRWIAAYQMARSAMEIAAATGRRPTTFAYPFGSLDAVGPGLLRDMGYAMAFTEVDGCSMTWPTRLAAPRVRVSATTSPAKLLRDLEACVGGG